MGELDVVRRLALLLIAAFVVGVVVFIFFVPVIPEPNPCPTGPSLVSCPSEYESISFHYFGVGAVNINPQECGYLWSWNGTIGCHPKYLP
ncbi:MAG: hypothetical protein OK436_04600 [Thaumarchaeota archaeon]|nr:hypothetical protein [Nitrososphaerota archaeon]